MDIDCRIFRNSVDFWSSFWRYYLTFKLGFPLKRTLFSATPPPRPPRAAWINSPPVGDASLKLNRRKTVHKMTCNINYHNINTFATSKRNEIVNLTTKTKCRICCKYFCIIRSRNLIINVSIITLLWFILKYLIIILQVLNKNTRCLETIETKLAFICYTELLVLYFA